MANIYKDRNESDKAIQLYKSSDAHARQANNKRVESWGFANLGSVYLSINNLGSSLMFSQKAYKISLRLKDETVLPFVLNYLTYFERLPGFQK